VTRFDAGTLDAQLSDAVEAGAVPGVALLVSTPDGVAYEGAAGRLRGDDPDAPEVGPDTIFRMASMTKAMATVAALQLVEQGRLTLDTPVQDVLPAFAELQVLDGWDGDEPRLRAPRRPPTVQDLMTHTSGLSYFFTNSDLVRWHEHTQTPTILTGLRAGLAVPMVCDPGARFEYGISTDWLGLVVEELAGAGLDEVLRAQLFEPLGMHDTSFAPTEEQRARAMAIHARTADGGLESPRWTCRPTRSSRRAGAGRGRPPGTTGASCGRCCAAASSTARASCARRPPRSCSPITSRASRSPRSSARRSPELTNDVPRCRSSRAGASGCTSATSEIPGMRAAGSGDWAGLFNCYYWVDRASGLSAALLTQLLPFFDAGRRRHAAGRGAVAVRRGGDPGVT
jgi:CubicO group peptidase (beta-lactamase class C family)